MIDNHHTKPLPAFVLDSTKEQKRSIMRMGFLQMGSKSRINFKAHRIPSVPTTQKEITGDIPFRLLLSSFWTIVK